MPNSLLILLIVILLGIAVWQLTKIFELTQTVFASTDANTEIASERDNDVNGYLFFALLAFIYVMMIYCIYFYGHLPLMSNSASEHGVEVDTLMLISMGLIFAVQFLTQALLLYFSFRYRGKKGRKAFYFPENNKLEAVWTIIPVIVLSALILYGLYTWNDIMFVDDEEEVIYVEIYAKQFSWDIRYSGKDGTLGKANIRFIKGINLVGVDMSDPNSFDDKMSKVLHLPVGKKVVLKIRSQDVIHSAYMPHFRAQMNCVPGMVTQFAMVPTVTTAEMRERPEFIEKVNNINNIRSEKSKHLKKIGKAALDPYTFDYLLLCNKICGAAHYNMQTKIIVETQEEFDKWLNELPTLGSQIEATAKSAEPVKTDVDSLEVRVVKT